MLLALPILLPMLGAGLCLAAWKHARLHSWIAVITTGLMVLVSVAILFMVREKGIQTTALGGWKAPIGIVLVADLLGTVMVVLGSIVGFAASIFAMGATDTRRARAGHYPLTLTLLAAVSGAFLTGDLFNLYVWFELMLLSSFVLLTLGGQRAQLEGAIKYVTLNLFSSILFLAAAGLIYAATGTLNMAHLAVRLDDLNDPELATALGALLLVGFGIKAAVFPVFFWLPASYHTPPPAVSALFAGLLTKVGVYSIIRSTTLMFDQEWSVLGQCVLVVAALTMVSGVLGAVAQNDMRRILSFHIVSQIGYMLMGLGVAMVVLSSVDASDPVAVAAAGEAGVIALAGAIFYIIHHIIVKTNLFLISGAVMRVRGTSELAMLGGIVRTHPALAALFFISAMSLAGIPILSGFWAKLALVRGGLEAGTHGIVIVSLGVSLLTLLSMTKIWSEAFWREPPSLGIGGESRKVGIVVMAPIVMMAALTVSIGLAAPWAFGLASDTATQLLDSSQYIEATLGVDVLEKEGYQR